MNNRGLFNHYKFRTKYWQERHRERKDHKAGTPAINGIQIQQLEQEHPVSARSASSAFKFMLKGHRERLRAKEKGKEMEGKGAIESMASQRMVSKPNEHNKWRLKRQLMHLDDDTVSAPYARERPETVRYSQDQRSYRGKSSMARARGESILDSHSRPATGVSLTLDVRPGSEGYRLEHRFSVV